MRFPVAVAASTPLAQVPPTQPLDWLVLSVAAAGFGAGFWLVNRSLHQSPSESGPKEGPTPTEGQRYRVLRTLGHGAHGVVHLARDLVLDREVVLKHLRTPALGDEARERVLREARLAGRVVHPNVVAVYDVTRLGDEDVIVMEYVPGGSLETLLERGRMEPARAVALVSGVLAGLERLHEAGVVHRDVKPSNVLISEDGTPKLSDLGVAHDAVVDQRRRVKRHPGTLRTMAPEQLQGGEVGPWTDVYAVGATLYRLVAGRPHLADEGAGPEAWRRALLEDEPALPLEGVPPALNACLERALARDPAQRYQSAAAFRRALAPTA